jgi:predicted nuclease with TOPRIM domain
MTTTARFKSIDADLNYLFKCNEALQKENQERECEILRLQDRISSLEEDDGVQ